MVREGRETVSEREPRRRKKRGKDLLDTSHEKRRKRSKIIKI